MSFTNHPNVKEVMSMEGEIEHIEGEVLDTEKTIRAKIIHVLSIYPKISISMLQVGMGTSLMPALWKPVLNQMIADKTVIQDRKTFLTPTERQQGYTILSLGNPDDVNQPQD